MLDPSAILDINPLAFGMIALVVVVALCARHSWRVAARRRRSQRDDDRWRRDRA